MFVFGVFFIAVIKNVSPIRRQPACVKEGNREELAMRKPTTIRRLMTSLPKFPSVAYCVRWIHEYDEE